ncbi:MAG: 16S rRNA (uracil(1498)-N(3))-methyltransferase [Burkholderiaceae bacterium]
MPRFHVPAPLSAGSSIRLPDTVAHHIQVLRLRAGDAITLFDGTGGSYAATLTTVERRHAEAAIGAFSPDETELPFPVVLAQALPEGAKMDWIVEKAVELGASAITPLSARRCVTRLSDERAEKKLIHWRAIVVAAAEQSGRNRLPPVAVPIAIERWEAPAGHRALLLSPRGAQSLAGWARARLPEPVALLVGPEGGFAAEEEDAAIARGALPLTMGPRILRTETAGLAALAALAACWDGM